MNQDKDFRRELERMSSRQLEERIHAEVEKEKPDDDLVLQILRILEARRKDEPAALGAGGEAAWEAFQARKCQVHKAAFGRWAGIAASFAILVFLLFGMIPQTATAGSVWKILTRYTDAILEYINIGQAETDREYVFETDNSGLQQVYDAVVSELGVTEPVVAQWLPDGYELVEITRIQTRSENGIYAKFSDGAAEAALIFSVMELDMSPRYAKAEDAVQELEINGIIHNYVRNNDIWLASWARQNLKCAIYIDCQGETLLEILGSIYEEGQLQ